MEDNISNLLACVIDARQPIQPILKQMGPGSKRGFSKVYEEMHSSRNIETLHGTLVKKLTVVGEGCDISIDYINPIPLLVHSCATSLGFFRLMQMCVSRAPGGVLRFLFYHDAVTPGNNLRPDCGRTFTSFLWSFLELPQWMKHRAELRWFTFSYVLKTQMKTAKVTISDIAKAILLDMFRNQDCNFETTGVLMKHGSQSQIVQMKFETCPQDWLAQVDMFSMKGQSGLNPCPLCDNCMGRRAFFEDESGFSHVLSPEYEKFKVRDSARVKDVLHTIENVAVNFPDDLEELEKASGLVYDARGLLFDKDLVGILDLSTAIYADTSHCLLASGGVAQYHLNQFILRIIDNTDVTLQDLDTFAKNIACPRSWGKLTPTFFQDRVVHKLSAHLRAFASEVLLAVDILGLFVEMVLAPAGKLSAEIECFKHLQQLLYHIKLGTYEHARPALDACRKHHQGFLALYAVCATPKLHYTWHAILAWMKHGYHVSCLGAEAEHKQPKRIMAYSYNKCTSTAISHWIRGFLANLNNPCTFAPTHLPRDAKDCDYTVCMGGQTTNILRYAIEIATPIGTFHKGDLLRWCVNGTSCLGIAKLFFMATVRDIIKFVAVVQTYSQVSGELWQECQFACVSTDSITISLPFVRDGNCIRPRSFGL